VLKSLSYSDMLDKRRVWLKLFSLVLMGAGCSLVTGYALQNFAFDIRFLETVVLIVPFPIIYIFLWQTWKRNKITLYIVSTLSLFGFTFTVNLLFLLITGTQASLNYHDLAIFAIPFTLFTTAYFLSKTPRFYRLAAWCLISVPILLPLAIYFFYSVRYNYYLFFLIALVLAVVLLRSWEVWLLATFAVLYMTGLQLAQDVFKLFQPLSVNPAQSSVAISNIIYFALTVFVVTYLLLYPARDQNNLLLEKNRQLEKALQELEERQKQSDNASRHILTMSEELAGTANHQAMTSQEQVTFLLQSQTALNELAKTAQFVAELASKVNQAAEEVSNKSILVNTASSASFAQSRLGTQAVQETIQVSQRVATRYQQLVNIMETLANSSSQMQTVLELIRSISDETRLLALNASIEAAGAGVMGERFMVVAQEVRDLASRSDKAGKAVLVTVNEILGSLKEAAAFAKEGYTEAFNMQTVARQAGNVIEEMREVAERALVQSAEIENMAGEVREFSVNIKSSTQQQNLAYTQVQASLENLKEIAIRSADDSNHLLTEAVKLEQMSQEWKLVTVKV
jgi:methyl-accepting chemotaxis protein